MKSTHQAPAATDWRRHNHVFLFNSFKFDWIHSGNKKSVMNAIFLHSPALDSDFRFEVVDVVVMDV